MKSSISTLKKYYLCFVVPVLQLPCEQLGQEPAAENRRKGSKNNNEEEKENLENIMLEQDERSSNFENPVVFPLQRTPDLKHRFFNHFKKWKLRDLLSFRSTSEG